MCAREIFLQQRPEEQTKGYYCPNKSAGKRALLIGTTGDGYNYYLKVRSGGGWQSIDQEIYDVPQLQEAQTTVFENGDITSAKGRELEPIKWLGRGGKEHYPTEEDFLQMVNVTIYLHYNTTLSDEKVSPGGPDHVKYSA